MSTLSTSRPTSNAAPPRGGSSPAGGVRIALVAFDDFTDLDLFFMWDLLNRVHLPGWSVRIVGDAAVHHSMTGLTVPIHGPLEEANAADAVLFTSGKGNRTKIEEPAWLSRFRLDPARQLIGSICSGALILAALGLLEGRRATTYPSAKPLLERYGVEVIERPFVLQGNVATAGGCLAAQYLVGWVIEELASAELSKAVIVSCQPVGEGLSFSTDVEAIPVLPGAGASAEARP